MNEEIKKVMAAMSAQGLLRTSAENVQDVLEALAKLAPDDTVAFRLVLDPSMPKGTMRMVQLPAMPDRVADLDFPEHVKRMVPIDYVAELAGSIERRRNLVDAPLPRDAEFALERAAITLDKVGETNAHAQVVDVLARHMPLTRCAAGMDGDCAHPQCPQLRDLEPYNSSRHCPLDTQGDGE